MAVLEDPEELAMHRVTAVTVYALIFAAACGAAWLASLSRHRWAPGAAFWITLLVLGTVAALTGVDLGGE